MTFATAPTAPPTVPHAVQLDHIDNLIETLEQAITNLIDVSWGTADDGSTSIPCPDGTGAAFAKRLRHLATSATAICEQRKDLAQPGDF